MFKPIQNPDLSVSLYCSLIGLDQDERAQLIRCAEAVQLKREEGAESLLSTSHCARLSLQQGDTDARLSIQLLRFLSQVKATLGRLPACVLRADELSVRLIEDREAPGLPTEALLRLLEPGELLCELSLYDRYQGMFNEAGLIASAQQLKVSSPDEGTALSLWLLTLAIDDHLELTYPRGDTWSVGRNSERALVLDRVRDVSSQRRLERPLVLIQAEAGLGKSSFLKSLYPLLEAQGLTVAYTMCLDFVSGELSGPLSTLTGALLASLAEPSSAPLSRQTLARLAEEGALPHFERDFIYAELLGLPLSVSEQSALSHYSAQRLWELRAEGLIKLIDRCLERRPLCVVFEDLHWLHEEGLSFLKTLLDHRVGRAGLIVLGTSRLTSGPLTRAPELSALTELISLRPLNMMESRELAERITRARRLPWQLQSDEFVSTEWLERCVVQAEGHPLYLTQLLSQPPQSEEQRGAQLDLKALLMSRYQGLSSGARALLTLGSCVGRIFSIELLSAFALSEREEALEELLRAHLLLKSGAQLEFCHDLLKDAVYQGQSDQERRRHHLIVAGAYQQNAELYAEHLALAQDERACMAFIEAAQQKVGAVQVQSALSLYDRALRLELSVEQRRELLCRQGWLYEQLGDGRRCQRCFEEALSQGERDPLQPPPMVLLGLLAAQRLLGELQRAEQSISQLQKIVARQAFTLPLFKARLAYYRGSIAFSRGSLEECSAAHSEATRALESLGVLDDREAMSVYAQAWSGRGDAAYAQGDFALAGHAMRRSVEIAREARLGRVEVSTLHMLAIVTTYLGEPEEGIALARECHREATRVDDLRATLFSELNVALPMLWAGRSGEASSYYESALQRARWMESPVLIGMSSAFVAFSMWSAGALDEASALAEESLSLSARAGKRLYGGVALGAALLTSDPSDPRVSGWLSEGLGLLKSTVVSHNYIYFSLGAAPLMVQREDWALIDELRAVLLEFFTPERPATHPNSADTSALKVTVPQCLLEWVSALGDPARREELSGLCSRWSASGLKLFEQLTQELLCAPNPDPQSLIEEGR